jgi:F-type H+-transporting ATPase subunit epsilon
MKTRYLKYVEACSQALRFSMKDQFRAAALRRNENGLKVAKWDAGKQLDSSRFYDDHEMIMIILWFYIFCIIIM